MFFDPNGKFIYVFSRKERDELIARGYVPVKFDMAKDIYVFERMHDEDPERLKFEAAQKFITSDTLTF